MRLTYDEKSFLIDGERIWLVSGEMHYFRVPRELWKKRMLTARENGINCISTYMAWNVHEPKQNQFVFSGDYDIEQYIQTADECGLYVVLRPGPYICAEWDFGGLPPYLNTLKGIELRTYNTVFRKRYENYFRHILPALSKYDVEHGGNIILIQNENEHIMPAIAGRRDYFADITRIYRECGFLIPIVHCNRMNEGEIDGVMECVNTWDTPIFDMQQLRKKQDAFPILITELWCGGCDAWGKSFSRVSAADVYRKTLLILAAGGQYNYYMWHGGTNFAFYGGRLQYQKDYYMITSYDLDAPLSEGGIRSEKYYASGLINRLALSVGKEWSKMEKYYEDREGVQCVVLREDSAKIAVSITERETSEWNRFGGKITIDQWLFEGMEISSEGLMPLNMEKGFLEFYGEYNQRGKIAVNQEYLDVTVRNRRETYHIGGASVVITPIDILLGESHQDKAEEYPVLKWRSFTVDNPYETAEWNLLEKPASVDQLQNYYGYIWYRITFYSEIEKEERLVLPFFDDRGRVYSEQKLMGIWGAGKDAGYEGIPIRLQKGKNTVYLLCDNLGRLNHSYKIGEAKGLYGMPYWGRLLPVNEPKIMLSQEAGLRQFVDWLPNFDASKSYILSYDIDMKAMDDLYLRLELNCCAVVKMNKKEIAEFQNPNHGFADCVIQKEDIYLGTNKLEIIVYTDMPQGAIREIEVMQLSETGKTVVEYTSWVEDLSGEMKVQDIISKFPVWCKAEFEGFRPESPVYIQFPDDVKGQLYLNGHNVGRVWAGVPQDTYYLPECWFEEENTLIFYSEDGHLPINTHFTARQSFKSDGSITQNFDVC